MKVFEAVNVPSMEEYYGDNIKLFLAGGIK